MSHLSPEELLDIVEGARPEPAHVAACQACRREVADARAVMARLRDVDVPEPSPLFWDHFSSRVTEAVAAESAPPGRVFASWRFLLPAGALALATAAVIAISVPRRSAPVDVPAQALAEPPAQVEETRPLLITSGDDQSFTFVADLADDMNMDPAVAAGLADEDAAARAVAHLSKSELQALVELLKAEIPAAPQKQAS
jgi:hypothetical protein